MFTEFKNNNHKLSETHKGAELSCKQMHDFIVARHLISDSNSVKHILKMTSLLDAKLDKNIIGDTLGYTDLFLLNQICKSYSETKLIKKAEKV